MKLAAPGIERLPMAPAYRHAAPLAFWPEALQGAAQDTAPGTAHGAGQASAHGAAHGASPETAQGTSPRPAALVLPALGVPAGAYRRLAECLAGLGTATGVAEWRGGGASPVRAARGVDWGYTDLLQHEVLGGLAALQQRLLGAPVVVIGHSLGGHLGLMARAIAAPGLAAVITVASGTPTVRFFSPALRWKLRILLSAHRMSGPVLGYFPGHRLGFGGRQSRTLMDEWAVLARRGKFEVKGRNLLEPTSEAARRVPVRSLSLPHDDYAPRAATEHLLQLAGVGPQAIERFEGPGPLGHFDWLKEPRALAERMHQVISGRG